jgi:hypothetical protein
LIVVAVAALSIAGAWIVVQWATLPIGLPPGGAACDYEDDPSSGTSGSGTERIEWGLLPERVCVSAEDRVYRDDAVHGVTNQLSYAFASLVLVGTLGVVAGMLTSSALKRRRLTFGSPLDP